DVKAEEPFVADQRFDERRTGRENLDVETVALADRVDEAIRLGMEAPGVEREHGDVAADLDRHVDEDRALRAGERDRDLREAVQGKTQDVLRGGIFVISG